MKVPDSQMDSSPGTTKVAAIPQKLLIARNSYSKGHRIDAGRSHQQDPRPGGGLRISGVRLNLGL